MEQNVTSDKLGVLAESGPSKKSSAFNITDTSQINIFMLIKVRLYPQGMDNSKLPIKHPQSGAKLRSKDLDIQDTHKKVYIKMQ